MKKRSGRIETHAFARRLLNSPNESIWMLVLGRLSVVWDDGKPVRGTVPTSEIFPESEARNV